MELKLLNDQGQPAAKVDAPDTIFGRDFNEPLVHQVLVAYRANAPSGNRKQKDRDRRVEYTSSAFLHEFVPGNSMTDISSDGVSATFAPRQESKKGVAHLPYAPRCEASEPGRADVIGSRISPCRGAQRPLRRSGRCTRRPRRSSGFRRR